MREGLFANGPEQYITLAWISPKTGGQGRLTLINRLLRLALEIHIHLICIFFSFLTSSILTLAFLVNLKPRTPNHPNKQSLEGGGMGQSSDGHSWQMIIVRVCCSLNPDGTRLGSARAPAAPLLGPTVRVGSESSEFIYLRYGYP